MLEHQTVEQKPCLNVTLKREIIRYFHFPPILWCDLRSIFTLLSMQLFETLWCGVRSGHLLKKIRMRHARKNEQPRVFSNYGQRFHTNENNHTYVLCPRNLQKAAARTTTATFNFAWCSKRTGLPSMQIKGNSRHIHARWNGRKNWLFWYVK